MRQVSWSAATRLMILAAWAGVATAACAAEKKGDVFKNVKLNELIAAIKAEKGKVVVVDFWADT